ASATQGLGATRVLNHGNDEQDRSWLVRERVFDVFPRGSQAERRKLTDVIFRIHANADVSLLMLADPTFDNVRWGYTEAPRRPPRGNGACPPRPARAPRASSGPACPRHLRRRAAPARWTCSAPPPRRGPSPPLRLRPPHVRRLGRRPWQRPTTRPATP